MIVRHVAGARVVFTDRHGGVSEPPYASSNLGLHVGDDPAAVHENRLRLAAGLERVPEPDRWFWLRQVHGDTVVVTDEPADVPPEADAAVTDRRGLPLVVLTADCAPLALVSDSAVAVVHAGWPGLEQGIVERAVEVLRATGAGAVRAVLGPCIQPARYEFGPGLLARLVARLGPAVAATAASGAPALDVPGAVRGALGRAGVDDVDDVGICTAASPDHFSHRRDGTTGRQALVVVRDE